MNNLSKILFLLLFSATVFAQQDLCKPTTDTERGGFTFDGPSTVCIGQPVKLRDNSGGTGVRYIFGYIPGQNISTTPSQTTLEYPFLAAGQYTVLQYGKKAGRDMYFCDVVYVRESNQPKFSYNSCGDNFLTIIIPKDIANNFDYYEVDWGDGKPVEKVTSLPFRNYRNYSTSTPTRNIRIEGFFNTSNSCPQVVAQTVPMRQGGNFVSIAKVELTDDHKEAIITLKGSDDEYDFYQRGRNEAFKVGQPDLKILPGVFKIKLVDTVQTCFTAIRNSGCTEIAGEVCTVKLESITAQDKNNIIKWIPHPSNIINNAMGVDGRVNSIQTTLIKEEKSKPATRILINNSPYSDNIDCSKEYCYQLKVKVVGTLTNLNNYSYTSISLSPKRCINRKEVIPDAITESIVTVKENNQVQIDITDNSPWTLQRKEYLYYKFENATLEKINSGTLAKQYTYASVDASTKSFCYKVAFIDECGSTSAESPPLCTVFLDQVPDGNLEWTNASPFGTITINKFEVQSFDEQTNAVSTETTKNQNEINYTPNLDNFDVEAKYRIKAISATGKESFSNTYTIPIAVKLFLPDAFTPNSDGINDELVINGTLRRIISFELEIYNNWGNPVFTSNDPTKTWDGTFQNTNAPSETYSFRIYAKLNDGKELNKSGKFLLLR